MNLIKMENLGSIFHWSNKTQQADFTQRTPAKDKRTYKDLKPF